MQKKDFIRTLVTLTLLTVSFTAFAQVDGSKTSQDTLYIYEEEVVYDTLYMYDSLPHPALMSKEELLDALRRDRGYGRLYHQRGHMYITGTDGELFRLDNRDLKGLLSASDYADYRKAKRNIAVSIPLYLASGCSAALAGIGLYQFCASFIQTAKYRDQLLESDRLPLDLWRSAMGGIYFLAGGALATTAFILPAIILTVKGKVGINNITNNFNSSAISLRLSLSPAPGGASITLSF